MLQGWGQTRSLRPALLPTMTRTLGSSLAGLAHGVRACSVAPDRDLHACHKRWVTWVQFDIFDTGKLAEDAGIPNAEILSMESLVFNIIKS